MPPTSSASSWGAITISPRTSAIWSLDRYKSIQNSAVDSLIGRVTSLIVIARGEKHPMKKITLAFAIAMAFVSFGCKKKGGGGGAAEAMAKMSEFKDEMCKCKDAKCAQDVSDKMTKWSQE